MKHVSSSGMALRCRSSRAWSIAFDALPDDETDLRAGLLALRARIERERPLAEREAWLDEAERLAECRGTLDVQRCNAFDRVLKLSQQFRAALESYREIFVLADDSPCRRASTDPACMNSAGAPHNIEASSVYAGDFYARAQERDHALRWYMHAKEISSWDSWRYQAVIEERIRTLDERMAAALTPSIDDDLPSVWSSQEACSICHAK